MIVTSMKELRNQMYRIEKIPIYKDTWELIEDNMRKEMEKGIMPYYIEYNVQMGCYDIYGNKLDFRTIYEILLKDGKLVDKQHLKLLDKYKKDTI